MIVILDQGEYFNKEVGDGHSTLRTFHFKCEEFVIISKHENFTCTCICMNIVISLTIKVHIHVYILFVLLYQTASKLTF